MNLLFNIRVLFVWVVDYIRDLFFHSVYADRISTTDLVNMLFNFCEVYSGKVMYKYQEQMSKRIIRSVLENDGEEITGLFSRQSGKCFAKDTEILMADGRVKKVQDIKVGDYVMRPDSTPARVTNLGRGREEMFEVRSREKNHESFTVNKSHILSLVGRKGEIENISVEDFLKLPEWKRKDYYRGYRVPVDFEEKKVDIDPYFLGLWIGDGNSHDLCICNVEEEVKEYLSEYAKTLGMNLVKYESKDRTPSLTITNANHSGKKNPLRDYLKKENLFKNKHIPDEIMFNSRRIRLEFLAGLIDSDGYKSKEKGKENSLEITSHLKPLAEQYVRLMRSLGFRVSMKEHTTSCNGKSFVSYRVYAYGDFSDVPIKVERRKYENVTLRENPLTFGFDLISKGEGDYYGFTIDTEDHLFLLGDYTVTHNTETIAITVGGLMIILPRLANMPMFVNDPRFELFKDGFWVGIFAPSMRQSQITYNRMRSRMSCKEAQAVLNDPDFMLEFSTSNGTTVSLTNGSYCMAISASDNSNIEGETFKLLIMEECQDISNYKIRKSIHPMGAAYNSTIIKIGTPTTFKGDFYETIQRNKEKHEKGGRKNHFEYNYLTVMKYNPRYAKYVEREKERLGETSDEFRMSYGLEWIISRGMFVDIEELEKLCGEDYLDIVLSDTKANHVAGLDIGGGSNGKNKKSADSTVCTICEVDWDNPVLMEKTTDEETNQDIVYMAFNTYIKNWLELSPEIAENYEEQYAILMEYFKQWRIARLVCDATREASLSQRIAANVRFEVIPFVFGVKSKSQLYKHLQTEIKTGRARYPNSEEAKKTPEHKKFLEQMGDLQKGYRGADMVVSHPDEKGAHDDYPDSWALAVWGARDPGHVDETETSDRRNVLQDKKYVSSVNGSSMQVTVTQKRNRRTGRRR